MVLKALLTDSDSFPFSPEDLRLLESAGVALAELPGHDPDELARVGASAHALFVYYAVVDAKLIQKLDACKVIARCGTGYDKIDVVAARQRGILVTYVPAYGAVDVAEHAMALIFACARRLARCDRDVQAGLWPNYVNTGPMRRLAGQTLGLLGFGRIAREVAARARALGLRVIAYDPYVEQITAAPHGADLVPFATLLAQSDYLSVHVPLTEATRHLLDERALWLLRPGAYLINTSRGAVVDQAALVKVLDAGHLGGAGLDVLEREPPEAFDALLGRPNVLITPHLAACTEEALGENRRTAVTDVVRVLSGEAPIYPVGDE
jgi:phosphoglycerate dehydrogenase-like enzyme